MPSLECPLGARCHDGENGATWKTQDVDEKLALKLQDQHVKHAHPVTTAPGEATLKAKKLTVSGEKHSPATRNEGDFRDRPKRRFILVNSKNEKEQINVCGQLDASISDLHIKIREHFGGDFKIVIFDQEKEIDSKKLFSDIPENTTFSYTQYQYKTRKQRESSSRDSDIDVQMHNHSKTIVLSHETVGKTKKIGANDIIDQSTSYETNPREPKGTSYETNPREPKGTSFETNPREPKGTSYETNPREPKGTSYETNPREPKETSRRDFLSEKEKREQEEKEELTEEVINYYRQNYHLPKEISLKTERFYSDTQTIMINKSCTFDGKTINTMMKDNEESRGFVANAGGSGVVQPGIKISAGGGLEHKESNMSHDENYSHAKSNRVQVNTTLVTYKKHFQAKPILDDNFLKKARKIMSAADPVHRFEALDETIKVIQHFKANPQSVPTSSFHAGGELEYQAIAQSNKKTSVTLLQQRAERETDAKISSKVSGPGVGVDAGMHYNHNQSRKEKKENKMTEEEITVSFKYKSKPDCKDPEEFEQKLRAGVKNWALYPDDNTPKEYDDLNILQMMKKKADEEDDKELKEVTDFLDHYMKSHTHFNVIGQKQTVSDILEKMSIKPITPSTILLPNDHVSSFKSLEDDPKGINCHDGSTLLMVLLVMMNNQIIQDVLQLLEIYNSTQLSKMCLYICDNEEQIEDFSTLKKQIRENCGISRVRKSKCADLEDFEKVLKKFSQENTIDHDMIDFKDFKREKVNEQDEVI